MHECTLHPSTLPQGSVNTSQLTEIITDLLQATTTHLHDTKRIPHKTAGKPTALLLFFSYKITEMQFQFSLHLLAVFALGA